MSKNKSKRTRQHRAPSLKAELLRKHHVDKVPISDLCDQNQLQPSTPRLAGFVSFSWFIRDLRG